MFLLPLGLLVRWVQIATATLLAVYLASLHSFFPAFSDTIPIHIGHRSNASENCPISLRNHCPISIGIGVRYGLEYATCYELPWRRTLPKLLSKGVRPLAKALS